MIPSELEQYQPLIGWWLRALMEIVRSGFGASHR